MTYYTAWVVFWASLMGVAGPIPVSAGNLGGKHWAQVWVDQYGMPSIRVDHRLHRAKYKESALHEVCHIRLKHHERLTLTEDQKEAEVGWCMRLYRDRYR